MARIRLRSMRVQEGIPAETKADEPRYDQDGNPVEEAEQVEESPWEIDDDRETVPAMSLGESMQALADHGGLPAWSPAPVTEPPRRRGLPLVDILLLQYQAQAAHALTREAGRERRPETSTGSEADLRRVFSRLAGLHPDLLGPFPSIDEVYFWGWGFRRIAIVFITGTSAELAFGFKVSDTRRTCVHENTSDAFRGLPQRLWRSWALGELVGWGRSGAR